MIKDDITGIEGAKNLEDFRINLANYLNVTPVIPARSNLAIRNKALLLGMDNNQLNRMYMDIKIEALESAQKALDADKGNPTLRDTYDRLGAEVQRLQAIIK